MGIWCSTAFSGPGTISESELLYLPLLHLDLEPFPSPSCYIYHSFLWTLNHSRVLVVISTTASSGPGTIPES
ncbi:hypothetical protein DPMN_056460 [Dreissena polymorpha]|uniref:Uncharacterized protein n=1 Tax=Dreissena polymorpha TaxID=45954 RepID=A0A9D4CSK1_DREPO|nr:hypothetical protein DPMN_056460 [Dreissena polymorpha]